MALLLGLLFGAGGCTTIRVTDPPETADMEFLMTGAAEDAINKLATDALRDRLVYVDTSWLIPSTQATGPDASLENALSRQPSLQHLFMVGELRAKLLKSGVRLVSRDRAQVVLEVRSGALSVNHLEFLLGLPASLIPSSATGGLSQGLNLNTPELSVLKSTKQYGWASVAIVAYWADSGELVAISGPFVGQTSREDFWIFGTGPRTIGTIPPAQQAQGK